MGPSITCQREDSNLNVQSAYETLPPPKGPWHGVKNPVEEKFLYFGFTGRADGMTPEQSTKLLERLEFHDFNEHWIALHNDGEGSDQAFAQMVKNLGIRVETTPSDLRPMPRNRELARRVEVLFAAPPTEAFVKHSGTWATIKYAVKAGASVTVITPQGNLVPMGA